MNDSNANNPDGNVIFSGTRKLLKILGSMSQVYKNGLETVLLQLEKF